MTEFTPNNQENHTETWQGAFEAKLKAQNLEKQIEMLQEQKHQLEIRVQQVQNDKERAYQDK